MPDPTLLYTERLQHLIAEHDLLDQRSRQVGNFNLAAFLLAFGVLAAAAFRSDWLLVGLAALIFAGFLAGLVVLTRTRRALQTVAARMTVNQRALARIRRDWHALPTPDAAIQPAPPAPGAPPAIDPATAADLDLLGHASLEQLLGTPNTPVGRATLRQWLLTPAAPQSVRSRQQSSAELAPQVAFREEIAERGLLLDATDQARYARFMAWAEGDSWLHDHRHWLWVARGLPLLVLALSGLLLAGYPVGLLLVAVVAVNLTILQTVGRRVGDDISRVAAQQGVFAAYAELFALLTTHAVTAPGLQALQARLGAGGLRADQQMRGLAQLMPLVDIRRSLYFFPVEAATLWSFHVLWLLERWQRTNRAHVRTWLEALGEAEALLALAALHHDHPAWVFPEVRTAGAAAVVAHGLAHPLLPPVRAVGNDVQVGPPGSYLLVTGSNMSGKSTLLRAIGVNVVLAQMGAPVCAAQMTLPSLALVASMRVQDSLEAGVSFYMAELRRLKEIVDLADAHDAHARGWLLYLLDEILQGTNTAERQIAARRIIRHLIDAGAIGAVSTHDLTLAEAPELKTAAQEVYFTEHFTRGADGPSMTFDYRLRPGIAVSTNALKLMELVGLLPR